MAQITLYFHYPSPNKYFHGKNVPKEEIVLTKKVRFGYFTNFEKIDRVVNKFLSKERHNKYVYAREYYEKSEFDLKVLGNIREWVKKTGSYALHFKLGKLINKTFFPHLVDLLVPTIKVPKKLSHPLFEPFID